MTVLIIEAESKSERVAEAEGQSNPTIKTELRSRECHARRADQGFGTAWTEETLDGSTHLLTRRIDDLTSGTPGALTRAARIAADAPRPTRSRCCHPRVESISLMCRDDRSGGHPADQAALAERCSLDASLPPGPAR